jgi:hypothetical protein
MTAPIANMTNDEPAATHGDGFSRGSTPSSCTRWKFSARFSSRCTSSVALVAVSRVNPISISIATSSALSACGCMRKARLSTRTSESICSLAVVTDVYSPSAMENAPASRPAIPLMMTVCVLAAAATPAMSAVLLTRPSIAPNVAARSQPPVTSECRCVPVCGTPVGALRFRGPGFAMCSIQRHGFRLV